MSVRVGLEILLSDRFELLAGKRVGVIVHAASVNHRLQDTLSLFSECPDIHLTTAFGPQHGLWGQTQDNMIEWTTFTDSRRGIPVYSLYGEVRKPTAEMLSRIDALVFDLQDVGSRYYTFIHTMALAMEACGELGKEFIVLDRPNPINGLDVEGPVLDPRFKSFVGLHPIPVRHGLTVAELAAYLNSECGIGCDLKLVPLEGWNRSDYADELDFPWVLPSPNMPSVETALVYPGMCLFEGTNVSEGRGTTLPFELSGAPWVDPRALVDLLDSFQLPGVKFRPTSIQPTFQKWQGELLGGVQVHVLDRALFKPFLCGLAMIMAYRELGGAAFRWKEPPYEYEYQLLPFDILCGTDQIRKMIEAGTALSQIERSWQLELRSFLERRQNYLLYE